MGATLPTAPPLVINHLTLRQRQALWAWAFLAVPLVFYGTIRFYPAVQAMAMSLTDWNIVGQAKFIGTDNYARLAVDPAFWRVMGNTVTYLLVGVVSTMSLGFVIAYHLDRVRFGHGLLRALYFIPHITTAVAIEAGIFHTCAILRDGPMQCWGRGEEGQLGNGSTANSSTPTTVPGIAPAILAPGAEFSCVLLPDGTVLELKEDQLQEQSIGKYVGSREVRHLSGIDPNSASSRGTKQTDSAQPEASISCSAPQLPSLDDDRRFRSALSDPLRPLEMEDRSRGNGPIAAPPVASGPARLPLLPAADRLRRFR